MSESKMFFASDEKEEKKSAQKKPEIKVEPKIEKPLVLRKRNVTITPEIKAKFERIKKLKAAKKIKK